MCTYIALGNSLFRWKVTIIHFLIIECYILVTLQCNISVFVEIYFVG